MTLAYILMGIGITAGILIFSIGAARFILDFANRRNARRETESLTAMMAGDQRTGDVQRGQVCPWPRAD